MDGAAALLPSTTQNATDGGKGETKGKDTQAAVETSGSLADTRTRDSRSDKNDKNDKNDQNDKNDNSNCYGDKTTSARLDCVRLLLEAGATPVCNGRIRLAKYDAPDRWPAMLVAATRGDAEVRH